MPQLTGTDTGNSKANLTNVKPALPEQNVQKTKNVRKQ
jgi:hypothetical protein